MITSYRWVGSSGHLHRRATHHRTSGFALIPLLLFVGVVATVATILAMEALSAVRITEGVHHARVLDRKRRAASLTAHATISSRPLSVIFANQGYGLIRHRSFAPPFVGIPAARQFPPLPPECPPSTEDPLSSRVCSTINISPGFVTVVPGGLHVLNLVIPAHTRILYVRGDVRIDHLLITGAPLTISALGSIQVSAVTALRVPPPTLELLSRNREYELPSVNPMGVVVLTGWSPDVPLSPETKKLLQPRDTIIGMIFP